MATPARSTRPAGKTQQKKPQRAKVEKASRRPKTDEATVRPAVERASAGGRARVRMYRHGLGDCFLIFLSNVEAGQPDFKILIDCGVILGTADAKQKMTDVVIDVVAETGGEIDLLVVTHEHWDHVSGFTQAAEAFANLKVGQVWVAWTEDPNDRLAKELSDERSLALTTLQRGAQALAAAGATDEAETVSNLLGFFGAAGSGSTKDALDSAKKMGPIRYCRPTDAPTQLPKHGARIYVLGPPQDAKMIRRCLPSKAAPQTYGLALDGSGLMALDVVSALNGEDAAPFSDIYAIPLDVSKSIDFFRQRYWGPGDDGPAWRLISGDWLDSASDLALALDSATNNTSLVLAIELANADVLLFVGDAQVGNWESWQDLSWEVDGKTVTGPNLLARTIFYKVGHHGSHNATLKTHGLEEMNALQIAAIPVDHEMALKKRWGRMPLPELVDALNDRTKGRLLRSDVNPPTIVGVTSDNALYFDISV